MKNARRKPERGIKKGSSNFRRKADHKNEKELLAKFGNQL